MKGRGMRKLFDRRVRALIAFTGAIAVFAALSVSPASANTYAAAAEPADSCASLFSSLSSFGASAARGDEIREPGSTETAEEVPAGAKGKGGPNFRVTIPVYFHVVHDGPIGNVTQEQIDSQISMLNLAFGGFEGGYNTGFRFKLAGVTRTDNAEWFRHGYGDKSERDMKRALHTGGRNALNYYSTEASYYLGWAYFPNLSDARLYLDGVVVDWESMPGTSTRYAGRYDQGKTAVHEVGHWLNLYHVFQGGCNNWGDYVADTPAQLVATRGCPEGQDSCAEPGIDSIHNYMDYSFDSCYNQFTQGQATRMQDAWFAFRANG